MRAKEARVGVVDTQNIFLLCTQYKTANCTIPKMDDLQSAFFPAGKSLRNSHLVKDQNGPLFTGTRPHIWSAHTEFY